MKPRPADGTLAEAVGPIGTVYAVEIADPVNSEVPSGCEAAFIRQNDYDLYDTFMGPAAVPAFKKAVCAALKPGGVCLVLDHLACIGTRDQCHRDTAPDRSGESPGGSTGGRLQIRCRQFDPSVRGKPDQFLYRFRNPQ